MPRGRRIFLEDITQHLIQRGNNRTNIFTSTADYQMFSECLHEASKRFGLRVHGYVLMANHFHLMATGDTPSSVPDAMQALGRRYVPYFNRRYNRTGALFEGRYRSFHVDSEAYWYACLRYVELNPVRAGLVVAPDLYRWSSYGAHALGIPNAILTNHPLYLRLGRTDAEREVSWRVTCRHEVAHAVSDLWQSATGSDPLLTTGV